MYFTNHDTYNNQIAWKPDNTITTTSISNKRYIKASFKTINPAGQDCFTNNNNVTKSNIINGTDFKAKPLVRTMYRYQYQTNEKDANGNDINYFTNSNKNFNISYKTPGDLVYTSTTDHTTAQPLCLYPDYKVNLNTDKKNRYTTTNAKRRVRNSNKPSSNICTTAAEQILQNTHNTNYNSKFYTTNQNYYNKRYSHSAGQYLQQRCKSFKHNQNTHFNKDTNKYTSNCTHNSLPNIYYSDDVNDAKQCCNTIVYKPNNKSFSQQGAVSSSARLLKLKKQAIETCAHQTNKKNNIDIRVSSAGYNNQSNQMTSKSIFNASGYSNCNNTHPCDMSVYRRPTTC